jgi:hypothetical protein
MCILVQFYNCERGGRQGKSHKTPFYTLIFDVTCGGPAAAVWDVACGGPAAAVWDVACGGPAAAVWDVTCGGPAAAD